MHPAKSLPAILLAISMSLPTFASPPTPDTPVSPSTNTTTPDQPPAPKADNPNLAGKPITTDIAPGKMITYKSASRDIRVYLVQPKNTPDKIEPADALNHPAVILVHDILGMTDFIKSQADALAKQGYTVLVPDLYSRIDNSEKGLDAKAAWIAYDTTSDQQVTRDLIAAIDYLEGPPVENEPAKRRIAVVGHDMGGIYAMMMAGADLRVTCAVNYYGRILYAKTSKERPASPVESLFNLRAPLLNFYGTIDPQIPATHLTTLESRLSRNLNKTFYQTITYPNVGHSFLNPNREGYNKEAAEKTAEKTKTFLAQYLRAAPPATE